MSTIYNIGNVLVLHNNINTNNISIVVPPTLENNYIIQYPQKVPISNTNYTYEFMATQSTGDSIWITFPDINTTTTRQVLSSDGSKLGFIPNSSISTNIILNVVTNNINNYVQLYVPYYDFTRGSFLIIIDNDLEGYACASFSVSKSSITKQGNVFRITSSASIYGEEILLVWNINEFPSFYYDPIRQIGDLTENITYNVRIFTV